MKNLPLFLSEGEICRKECKMRSSCIFETPATARKYDGEIPQNFPRLQFSVKASERITLCQLAKIRLSKRHQMIRRMKKTPFEAFCFNSVSLSPLDKINKNTRVCILLHGTSDFSIPRIPLECLVFYSSSNSFSSSILWTTRMPNVP